jgi:putative adenylate-forming enzyme
MNKLIGLTSAIRTWWDTRRLRKNFQTRQEFTAWQKKKIDKWINKHTRKVEKYSNQPEGTSLQDFPVVEKHDLMADFAAFNIPGITAEQGWSAFDGDRTIDSWHLGASTGTSGNRGLFVISDMERYLWLGTMLGKLLPDIWKRRERIAVILPLHTRLYDATNDTRWLTLGFFDLSSGFDDWIGDLQSMNPTIIIAPPRALRWLAENAEVNPRQIYSAAEVLDPVDARIIEARWPDRTGQIYMATEGLLATTCSHGALHLAEDVMHFELEPAGNGLFSPIITDFRRTTQIMCRYRMNDLLRVSDTPCSCGSPLKVVEEIVGRQDDCFILPGPEGPVTVTPDILRNAILDTDRSISDFRLIQTYRNTVELLLPQEISCDIAARAAKNLQNQFIKIKLHPNLNTTRKMPEFCSNKKLRRVENRYTGAV